MKRLLASVVVLGIALYFVSPLVASWIAEAAARNYGCLSTPRVFFSGALLFGSGLFLGLLVGRRA